MDASGSPHGASRSPAHSPSPDGPQGERQLAPSGGISSRRTVTLLLATVSLLFLLLAFAGNLWRTVDPRWLDRHQLRMEGFIVGRMVETRQNGPFSAAGFPVQGSPTGYWIKDPQERHDFQYRAYLEGLDFNYRWIYKSQIGMQGMLFGIVDRLLPLEPARRLELYHLLNSILLALCLTVIALWFRTEVGIVPALAVTASLGFSQWLLLFGRDLWWSTWAFYLPLAAPLLLLQRQRRSTGRPTLSLAAVMLGAVFVKCLFNGYEYITVVLVMAMVPLAYHAVADGWSLGTTLTRFAAASGAAGLAVLVSLAILAAQIGALGGGFREGVRHVMFSLEKRTHGNPDELPEIYRRSLQASIPDVVSTYLEGSYLTRPGRHAFDLVYRHLLVIFLAASIALLLLVRKDPPIRRRRFGALVLATWCSILAPLSWFVIFSAHSFAHPHMNFIVWQMPFTLFGFAVTGSAVALGIQDALGFVRRLIHPSALRS